MNVEHLLEKAQTATFQEIGELIALELNATRPRKTAIDGLVEARLSRHADGWHYPDMRDGKTANGKARCRFPKREIDLLKSLNPAADDVLSRGKTSKSGKWSGDSRDDEFLADVENAFVAAALNSHEDAEPIWKMLGCAAMVRTVRQTATKIREERQARERELIKTDPHALARDLARELSA